MVQSGLRRTVGVWLYFIVGVKGLAVDWVLELEVQMQKRKQILRLWRRMTRLKL
jgi:hypothetical protein